MRISEIDFLKFLPDLMQDDPDAIAITAAQNKFYRKIASKIDIMSRWGKFAEMTEEELDLFAQDFYIPWYKTSDTKAVKVSNLEHFIDVWSTLGTPKAIETVLEDIYGSAVLIEWFSNKKNYNNGEFAVQVKDFTSFTQENKNRLYRILEVVKRKSQKLSSVFTVTSVDVNLFVGVRAVALSNGISETTASFYLPSVNVSVNNYTGLKASAIKVDVSTSIAE